MIRPPVIDSHVYCFTPPDTPAGHASGAEHMAYWQRQYALHHQPAFRVRDRAPGDSHQLLDPCLDSPLRLAGNRHFRVDRNCNRLIWTIDGEDYTKQQLPPNVIEFSAGAMVAEMDHAGVDWGLIHADATLTRDTAYLAACVAAFPDRLGAMAPIDEWLIPEHPEQAIRQAIDAIQTHRLHALKIIPAYAYQRTASRSFNDASWRPFWQAVAQLGVPVFFTLGSRPGAADPRRGFIDELWELRKLLDLHPTLQSSITHGYPWRDFLTGETFNLPEDMWSPLKDTNTCLEVGFPYRVGDLLDYPYPACRPVLEQMLVQLGSDRLLWGSDMPFQNRYCTYRQSRDYIERYCDLFLSAEDRAKLMGGNTTRLLKLARPESLERNAQPRLPAEATGGAGSNFQRSCPDTAT
ncbi:MAG: amidohydrolase [Verrucomicrobia bacterium]|nr:amidohydrolase [Verrucomicrobiota bacterium]